MLDFLIIIGIILGFLFLLIGKQWMEPWPFYVSAATFLILGSGILLTGYETFNGGDLNFDYDNQGDLNRVFFQRTTLDANLEENPLLFMLGNIFIAFALISVWLGLREAGRNALANKNDDE